MRVVCFWVAGFYYSLKLDKQRMNQTIIVKFGSQLLHHPELGINRVYLDQIAAVIASVQAKQPVLVVSSGAVAAGRSLYGDVSEGHDLAWNQALSALGQPVLMQQWCEALGQHKQFAAQVLADKGDFKQRQRYLNLHRCLNTLINRKLIPIVNENDATAVDELMFTDNDELAGLLAGMLQAQKLVLFTAAPGVMDGPPDQQSSQLIKLWDAETSLDAFKRMPRSRSGRGGISSKIAIAVHASAQGCETIIADGRDVNEVQAVLSGQALGTRFPASLKPLRPFHQWLTAAQTPWSITVDKGCESALLNQGSSLLTVGIVKTHGHFEKGDVVSVKNEQGQVFAIGQVKYAASELDALIAQSPKPVMIHRNQLCLVQPPL